MLSTIPLLSFNQRNGREIHLDRDSHRILFAQQSNSEAIKSQVFRSSNVIPGHSRFFSEVPRYITPLTKQHPHTTARPFPGAASWHLRYRTKKWPLFLPAEHCCLLLWDEKIITVSDSWLIQLDKILVFQEVLLLYIGIHCLLTLYKTAPSARQSRLIIG